MQKIKKKFLILFRLYTGYCCLSYNKKFGGKLGKKQKTYEKKESNPEGIPHFFSMFFGGVVKAG